MKGVVYNYLLKTSCENSEDFSVNYLFQSKFPQLCMPALIFSDRMLTKVIFMALTILIKIKSWFWSKIEICKHFPINIFKLHLYYELFLKLSHYRIIWYNIRKLYLDFGMTCIAIPRILCLQGQTPHTFTDRGLPYADRVWRFFFQLYTEGCL